MAMISLAGGDVEALFPRHAVADAAEADDDVAQRAVVHVERAPPGDAARIDLPSALPLLAGVVDHRREQVVGAS